MGQTQYNAIEVTRAASLDEALSWMARHAAQGKPLRPMAGCTDIMVDANEGRLKWDHFIDLWALRAELAGLRWQGEGDDQPGALEIGALCTYAELQSDARVQAELPALCRAASQVGATQIQARGTLAGNVENGSPAADGVPMLMALDARVRLASASGQREVALDAYYTGYRQTVRRPDELIAALVVPPQPVTPRGTFFRKVGTRAFQAITKVGLAARLDWRDGAVVQARVVAIAMAPVITRCPSIEAALLGARGLTPELRAALRTAQGRDLTPIDDIRSTAAYRNQVFHHLVCQATEATRPEGAA